MIDVSLMEQVKTHLSKLSAETGVYVRFEWQFWADSGKSGWRTGTERFEIHLDGYRPIKPLTFTELLELKVDDLRPKEDPESASS